MKNKKLNKGFTLIELVVVIVILGILAVTAAPKYINLQADARTATLNGVKASMEGASTLVHSKSLVAGNQSLPANHTPAPSITLTDGTTLTINYGYPRPSVSDWQALLDLNSDDFLKTITPSGVLIIFPTYLGFVFSDTEDCIVTYRQASSNSKPVITVNPCV